MTEPQRYSGPELGPLLRKVRDELGEDAAIVEANKVRSGGVAGFFTNEHYEVVADRRRSGSMAHADDPTPGPAASPAPRVASASQPRAGSVDRPGRNPTTGNTSSRSAIQSALLERAEHVSTQEFLSRAAESDSISLGGDDFDSVLNHFLDEDTAQSPAPPEPRRRKTDAPRQPPPNHRDDAPRSRPETRQAPTHGPARHEPTSHDPVRYEPVHHELVRHEAPVREPPGPDQPDHEPPPEAPVRDRDDDMEGAASEPQRQRPAGGRRTARRSLLWRYVLSARGWQCPTVVGARVVWFIGPYAAANSVERRFGPREPHDVMHLSPEPELGPRWATTNSFDEALERCRRWRQLDVAGSIVVDYPADEFDLQLLGELSPGLCDAVHLVTDNLDNVEALADLCHFAPVPVMVDLIQAPPSSEIGTALDAGLPIASILGMEMTPQLIVAIRLDAAYGEEGGGGNG